MELKKEYYIGKSKSWAWIDSKERWWEIFVIIDGFNGVGGFWLRKRWRWNNSSQIMSEEVLTLSNKESIKIVQKIKDNMAYEREEQNVEGFNRR